MIALEIEIKKDGTTDFDKTKSLNKMKMALNAFISIKTEEINPETIRACKNIVDEFKNPLQKIEFDMNIPQGYANNEQVRLLADLNNHIQESTKDNSPLWARLFGERTSVCNGNKKWSFKQVLNSNRRMNGIIDKINNHTIDGQTLSAYEKYLAAYGWVSSFTFRDEGEKDKNNKVLDIIRNIIVNDRISRDPLKILQDEKRDPLNPTENDYIVCLGYASLLERICQGIGLKCAEQGCEVVDRNEKTKGKLNHASNAVHLKDSKYGIDGIYYADSTKDGREENDDFSKYCWHALSYDKIKTKRQGSIERLDLQNARDNKSPFAIVNSSEDSLRLRLKMKTFINSFEPEVLKKLSSVDSIPLETINKAVRNALTCNLGQANNLNNIDNALVMSVIDEMRNFGEEKNIDEKEVLEICKKVRNKTPDNEKDNTIV